MFRNYDWNAGQKFSATRFGANQVAQDSKQVWFAGVHADVGGGYPEVESGIAKFPLQWMLAEAEAAGARVRKSMLRHLAKGQKLPDGRMIYVREDASATIHRSLSGAWWLLEFLPKGLKWKRWPARSGKAGIYIPRGEPRFIPEGALVHQSVIARMAKLADYRPVNLPATYEVEG
jgi:uncharacterized protein (DUF2235 family)